MAVTVFPIAVPGTTPQVIGQISMAGFNALSVAAVGISGALSSGTTQGSNDQVNWTTISSLVFTSTPSAAGVNGFAYVRFVVAAPADVGVQLSVNTYNE